MFLPIKTTRKGGKVFLCESGSSFLWSLVCYYPAALSINLISITTTPKKPIHLSKNRFQTCKMWLCSWKKRGGPEGQVEDLQLLLTSFVWNRQFKSYWTPVKRCCWTQRECVILFSASTSPWRAVEAAWKPWVLTGCILYFLKYVITFVKPLG